MKLKDVLLSQRFIFVPLLLIMASFRQQASAAAPTVIYSTGFGTNEGYSLIYDLEDQQGWLGTGGNSGNDNGLTTCCTPGLGQAAYIGYGPLAQGQNSLFVWYPLNVSPLASNTPIVKFSVAMKLINSTTTNFDSFRWAVYNGSSQRLLTLDFEVEDGSIWYQLEKSPNFVYTGHRFGNDVLYSLVITMDLGLNKWSATLDEITLVSNLPITITNTPLTLGDIDAVWLYSDPAAPGDNFMVFDNYKVTAEPRPPPQLLPVAKVGNLFQLLVTGDPNRLYAIEANTNVSSALGWTILGTNRTASDGTVPFLDMASPGFPRRFYRARLAQ